jgi:gamma-glutamyltranspeptidase/glutathione hydrolase
VDRFFTTVPLSTLQGEAEIEAPQSNRSLQEQSKSRRTKPAKSALAFPGRSVILSGTMTKLSALPLSLALIGAGLCPSFLAARALGQEAGNNVLADKDEQPVRARHGMVVTVHHLASDAGLAVLQAGGNAVDAAVATGFALAVVHPAAGNLGGGGFMLLRTHDGHATFIDYREKAPLAATETMYQDAQGSVIPPNDMKSSVIGYRSIATPGSVAGMVYAERKYGKLGLKRVMAPAIKLASDGFVLTAEEAGELKDPDLARFADSKRIFQRDGNLYKEGETFRQPELARTLTRIAADPDDFYHGKLAHELVDELHKGGALVTAEDLARYTVAERTPVTGSFHNYTVISAPPPSSGGIVLISALNILEHYDLARLGDRSPEQIHLITEAYRRAYMDRSDYLGDPDYNTIPTAALTAKAYADAWRASIDANAATPSASLKRPEGFLPPAPRTAGSRRPDSPDTTHYSVVDAEGNAVSVTTTLNDGFGSHVTAGPLGFLLNDEMDDFAGKMGVPNMFGLIQGPANAIAPGKRPLSSMTPTIVLEDGKLRYVLGSPGGARIISTVGNIFLSAAEGGLNIQQAVDAPRFHHQDQPDKLYLEPGFPAGTRAALEKMGYPLSVSERHWSNGECIAVDLKTGELEGGQDHRSHYGKAAGY